MHILYIHQYFATPSGSTTLRSYEFARRWVGEGHKVTLITGRSDRCGLKLHKALVQKLVIEGINVTVVGIKSSNKHSFFRRMVSFLCFMLFSIYAGLRTKNVDAIYATSTPLSIGISGMVLKWLKRVPFVFEVRDRWPEVPIEMGIIKNKIMIRVLLWLEKTIYKQSAAIIALSPGIADGVRDVIGKQKSVVIIPNSCDTDIFRPDVDGSITREQKGWAEKLVFLHAGAMGTVNGLDFVVSAAERLKSYRDIHFVLIGGGRQKTVLMNRIKQLKLHNIEVMESVPKTELAKIMAACDASLVIIANYPILEHNSANKFFDSLSAGKPVLLNYSGWQREVLEANNAGYGCKQYDIEEFIEKVLYLSSHREKLAEMGRNARQLAIEEYDSKKLGMKALEVITSVYAGRSVL